MAVRARASLEEWTATTESRDGPRTQVPHRDRRLVVRLDSTAEDEDPLATWRAARDAEAAEAHARSLKMPWGKLHGKTGLREEGMSGQGAFLSSGFDTVDHEGSHHSPEDQTTRFDDTALSMLEHDMMLRRSRSSRGRSQVVPSREYWRPWLPQPEATVTVAPSREELGRREHDGPRPEQRSPGAKEVLWDYRTMQAHKQLWGGGGNWQPSVDAWEAKEAAKRAADARIAQV